MKIFALRPFVATLLSSRAMVHQFRASLGMQIQAAFTTNAKSALIVFVMPAK